VSVMDRARVVLAETKASGILLRYEPIPMLSMPWEGPARWRIGTSTWDDLKREAEEIAGPYNVIANDANVTLYGYPVKVDEDADENLLRLEVLA
jgi:hypothetical protein